MTGASSSTPSASPSSVSVESNVLIKNMTILAPVTALNIDGIDADSSTNVCIEDCYIESGDDLVAVKSGWDEYGIMMARPSTNIIIIRASGTTPTCSGIGIGSEMSSGISDVTIEDVYVCDLADGVRMKADMGRGRYITNISVTNLTLERVKIPIKFSRGANDHPDDKWDPKAIPRVKGVYISNVASLNSTKALVLLGLEAAPYEGVCMKNFTAFMAYPFQRNGNVTMFLAIQLMFTHHRVINYMLIQILLLGVRPCEF